MQSPKVTLMKRVKRAEHAVASLVNRVRQRPAARRLVFLHIPKCAGTSVNLLFKSALGSGRSGNVVLIDDQTPGPAVEALVARGAAAKFVGGHFGMDTLERVKGDAVTFTILRDPFERLRSIYGHLSTRVKGSPVGELVYGMKLEDFLASEDPAVLQWSHNVMARMLAASHDRAAVAGLSDNALAARAIERARRLDAIAFIDTLDDDIAPLAAAAGVRYGGALTRENTTAKRAAIVAPRDAVAPIPPSLRDLAMKRIGADIEVYEALRADRAGGGSS